MLDCAAIEPAEVIAFTFQTSYVYEPVAGSSVNVISAQSAAYNTTQLVLLLQSISLKRYRKNMTGTLVKHSEIVLV